MFQPWNPPIAGAVRESGTAAALSSATAPNRTPIEGVESTSNPGRAIAAKSSGAGLSLRVEPKWVGWILVAGAALRLGWLILGLVRLRFCRRGAQALVEKPNAIEGLKPIIPDRAAVMLSHEIQSPVTFGFLRPVILLPHSFLEMSEDCRGSILLHELSSTYWPERRSELPNTSFRA